MIIQINSKKKIGGKLSNTDKNQQLTKIKELTLSFCDQYFDEELTVFVLELCDRLARKRKISITRGQPDIWAASIIYVIARLNFLFDKSNPFYITADTICDFFKTKKSTTGNKASQIEKVCNIRMGEIGLCRKEISEMLLFVETPEGFILPLSAFKSKVQIDIMSEEEEKESQARLREEKRLKEQQEAEERTKKKAENFEKKHKNQLKLF